MHRAYRVLILNDLRCILNKEGAETSEEEGGQKCEKMKKKCGFSNFYA